MKNTPITAEMKASAEIVDGTRDTADQGYATSDQQCNEAVTTLKTAKLICCAVFTNY